MQVEMNYFSHVTGDPSFARKANAFYKTVKRSRSLDGLWPNCWQQGRGKIHFGADGDSFYEYFPKVWLQTGKTDHEVWEMYDKSITGMEKHLLRHSSNNLDWLGQLHWNGEQGEHVGRYVEEMEHLMCFVPGWLALGAQYQVDQGRREHHLTLAASLAYTCYEMYERQPTGIGPERVKNMKLDLSTTDTREYILRPEAAEGWWYMHELTQAERYRDWGWKTFQNFEKWLRVKHGYASLKDVSRTDRKYIDRMESFFLAETIKYLYLLQDPNHEVKLDKYVFNTEAHPLSFLEFVQPG